MHQQGGNIVLFIPWGVGYPGDRFEMARPSQPQMDGGLVSDPIPDPIKSDIEQTKGGLNLHGRRSDGGYDGKQNRV
jgi:hypothetical protein